MTTNSTTNQITFKIFDDTYGGSIVYIFVGNEEYSRHEVSADRAYEWAQQEVAWVESRRSEESAFLAQVNEAAWLAQVNH